MVSFAIQNDLISKTSKTYLNLNYFSISELC